MISDVTSRYDEAVRKLQEARDKGLGVHIAFENSIPNLTRPNRVIWQSKVGQRKSQSHALTPLAAEIVVHGAAAAWGALPRPQGRGPESLPAELPFARCFEASQVAALVDELAGDRPALCRDASLNFLPAGRTWIEWRDGETRLGWLLWNDFVSRDTPDLRYGETIICAAGARTAKAPEEEPFVRMPACLFWPVKNVAAGRCGVIAEDQVTGSLEWAMGMVETLTGFLAIINERRLGKDEAGGSPRSKMTEREGSNGTRYTEIVLAPSAPLAPPSPPSPPPEEPAIRRHFCRAHKRQVGGRETLVREHWRGDSRLGVCVPKYTVELEGKSE